MLLMKRQTLPAASTALLWSKDKLSERGLTLAPFHATPPGEGKDPTTIAVAALTAEGAVQALGIRRCRLDAALSKR